MLDLGTPDDFRAQPYAWLTNQMSHALAGLAGAWLLMRFGLPGWGAVAGAALASGAVEAVHLRRGGTVADSIGDLLFVAAGAVWQATGGSFWLLALLSLGLAAGVRTRAAGRDGDARIGGL